MTGILTPYFDALKERQSVASLKSAIDELTPEQRDEVAALALGIAAPDMNEVGAYATDRLQDDIRRDAQRARIWEIEQEVCQRIPDEVSAEIDRATAVAPDVREHSKATRTQYASDQAHFARFCEARGVAPMPAEPAVLALYIIETRPTAALLKRRLGALADLHRQCARILPRKHAIVQAAIRHVKEITKQETKDNGEATGT